ncbi:MAG TPA: methyltransferase domain-containing protein [Candidatus Eisenbacteria bacterium]|nr:methyltransferase domain-containing protein [Candidatus Eisenbacteria bacterium]
MSTTPDSPRWDAARYHRLSDPQLGWARRVLERLPLSGGETVLDCGCGSGRVSALLLERLPRGRLIALDRSADMVREAHRWLSQQPLAGRTRVVLGDAAALPLRGTIDAILSTATFHWVVDQDTLARQLFAALKPGGRLVVQMGGGPNVESLHRRVRARMAEPRWAGAFAGWRQPWVFPTPEQACERLRRAGFVDVRAWLEPQPTPFPDRAAYGEFVAHVVLHAVLARQPESARDEFLAPMLDAAGRDDPPYTLDYWRLNLDARRPGA